MSSRDNHCVKNDKFGCVSQCYYLIGDVWRTLWDPIRDVHLYLPLCENPFFLQISSISLGFRKWIQKSTILGRFFSFLMPILVPECFWSAWEGPGWLWWPLRRTNTSPISTWVPPLTSYSRVRVGPATDKSRTSGAPRLNVVKAVVKAVFACG